jgi:hypothetical protein
VTAVTLILHQNSVLVIKTDKKCHFFRICTKLLTLVGKGKVVAMLFFNLALRHEGVLGEGRYSSTHSLTSPLDGGKWSASRSGRFTPRERAPGTHWIRGWVGPRDGLNAVSKRKIHSPRRDSNSDHPARSQSLYRLNLPGST